MSEYVAELSETVYTANVNEPHIVIADDRSVLVPDELKEIAVQFDHNIETVTFDCPRYWDEHDLSKMHIFINYKCANGRLDGYLAENVEVDADDESIIHFTWTLKENITCANGKICFLVCAKKSNEEGVLQNRWNSKPCNDCYVVEGLDVDVSEEIEQSLDLVEQILLHLDTSAAEAHACAKRAEVAAEEARSAADNAVSSVKENFDVIRDEKITEIASATGVEIANVETAASEATAEAESRIEAKGAAVLATIPEEYTETYQRALRNESRISRNEKRLANLEQGITPDPYHVDDTVAYSKDVPDNALPFAEVNKVGGMTRKCTNLIRFPYIGVSSTVYGVTYTINQNGTISLSGKATSGFTVILCEETLSTGSYYLSDNCFATGVNFLAYDIDASEVLSYEGAFTLTKSTKVRVYYLISVGFDGAATVYPMLNSGSEALPYEPYFEGLRSAPVTEVESVGANLWDNANAVTPHPEAFTVVDGGFAFRRTDKLIGTGTYYGYNIPLKAGDTVHFHREGSTYSIRIYADKVYGTALTDSYVNDLTYIADADYPSAVFCVIINSADPDGVAKNITVNRGATALPYTPYTRNTLPIPEAVQALDGYGWGVNDTVYNYIDWEKKQFVKKVGRADMGMISWSDTDYPNTFRSGVANLKEPDIAINRATGFIITKYPPSSNVVYTNIDDKSAIRYQKNILVRDSDYADAATFKAAMSGVMLYYELAEPIITDISDLLTEDNYIPVEGGGTVTMVNEYGYAVPSEIIFALKGAE